MDSAKDYEVVDLKEEWLYGDRLLMAGLLTLYEQRRIYTKTVVQNSKTTTQCHR